MRAKKNISLSVSYMTKSSDLQFIWFKTWYLQFAIGITYGYKQFTDTQT